MNNRLAVALGILVGSTSCGGSDSTDPTTNNNAPCTVTVTGATAIAGTYVCTLAPATIYTPSSDLGAFSMTTSGSRSVVATIIFTGIPTTTATYAGANSSALPSYAILVTSGTGTWEMTGGKQLGAPLGSFALKYSSVAVAASSSTGTAYTTHGTLDATLVPGPGSSATGNAAMHVVF